MIIQVLRKIIDVLLLIILKINIHNKLKVNTEWTIYNLSYKNKHIYKFSKLFSHANSFVGNRNYFHYL